MLRSVFARLGLVLVGTLVGVGLFEAYARTTWTAPWYEQLLTAQTHDLPWGYTLNRWNLRDRDYEVPKPKDVTRVMMLGDSFTFGAGVLEDERIFPEIVERRLNEADAGLGPGRIEVLNGGLPGSLTGDWVNLWERLVSRFDPDVLVLVFFLRDGTKARSIPDFFGRIRDEIAQRNQSSTLYRYSFGFRLVRDSLDRLDVEDQYTKSFFESYFGDEDQTEEWQRAKRNVSTLRDEARRLGVPVGLAVFPVLVELNDGHPFAPIQELVLQFGHENQLAVHDLLPAFRGERGLDLWLSPLDQHPNARAHALAAESLLPFLEALIIEQRALPKRPKVRSRARAEFQRRTHRRMREAFRARTPSAPPPP